jgi:hypothetical protein
MIISSVSLPLTSSAKGNKTWSASMQLSEPGGAFDTVIFSEAPDANDGSPQDSYDVPKPIPPMPPYIRAWFSNGLAPPFDQLWEDCRFYPDSNKIWSLSIQWFPQDYITSTTITMSWDNLYLSQSEYSSIYLYQDTTLVADMLTQTNYTFTAQALSLYSFSIICTLIGNQPPIAVNDVVSTQEDIPTDFNVSQNDYDLDGALDYNSLTITVPAAHGTIQIQPNTGIITYDPSSGYSGQDTFSYTIDDNQGASSNQAQVNVTILHNNQPPIVSDIPNQIINEGAAFTQINLDDYVEDQEDPDENISWTHSGNNQLTITINNRIAAITIPNPDWSGQETISFIATDTTQLSDQDEVLFEVIPQNDPPITTDDTYNVDENSIDNNLEVLINDYDPDGDPIYITSVSIPNHGTVTYNNQTILYTPNTNYSGPDLFNYTVRDDNGSIDVQANVYMIIKTNQPPTIPTTPNGPSTGYISTFYTFTTVATDPENQDLIYGWDLNNDTLIDEWTGPYESGESGVIQKSWTNIGTYQIKVKARDILTKESAWSTAHTITIKKKTTSGGGGGGAPVLNLPPTADAIVDIPYYANINTNILFDASNSKDSDGFITEWNWDLGDDTTKKGETITHQFTNSGTYTIILTVIDNLGASDTDQLTIDIIDSNTPPRNIKITGPTTTNKQQSNTFTLIAYDQENDSIQFIINWGDNTNTSSLFIASGTTQYFNHSWTFAGRYIIQITAQDNTNTTNTKSIPIEQLILVDVWDINDIITGYLIDNDSDGIYDMFHNNNLLTYSSIEIQPNGTYLIDAYGNLTWDYLYDIETDTLYSYVITNQTETYPIMIIGFIGFILLFLAILIINSIRHRRNGTKKSPQKSPIKRTKTSGDTKKTTTKKQ